MKNTAIGALLLSISSIVFLIAGYVINVWLGRFLGPAQYGVYGVIIAVWGTVNLILTNGIPQAVAKFTSENINSSGTVLKKGLISQALFIFLISGIYFLSADFLSRFLRDYKLTPYIQLSTLIFPFYGMYAVFEGYYNGLHDFRRQSIMNITYSISKAILIIILAYFYGLNGVIIAFIFSALLALISGIKIPKEDKFNFTYKDLVLFSIPFTGYAVLSFTQQSADLFFVKSLLQSDVNTGFYTASQNVAKILFFGLSSVSLIVFPKIAKSYSSNSVKNTRKIIRLSLRFIVLVTLPCAMLISSTSLEIINLLYTNEYNDAASPLSILIFGFCFLTIYSVISNILNGINKPYKSLYIAFLSLVITIISCLLLIPRFNLIGAALSTTIGGLIAMILAGIVVYRQFGTLVSPLSVIRILFASLVIYFLARIIPITPLLLPVLYCVLFAVYFVLLILIKEITHEDRNMIKSLMPNKIAQYVPWL